MKKITLLILTLVIVAGAFLRFGQADLTRFDKETTKLPNIKHVSIEHQEPFKATLHVDRTKVPIKKVLNTYLEKCKVADVVLQDPPIEEVIQHFYKP